MRFIIWDLPQTKTINLQCINECIINTNSMYDIYIYSCMQDPQIGISKLFTLCFDFFVKSIETDVHLRIILILGDFNTCFWLDKNPLAPIAS